MSETPPGLRCCGVLAAICVLLAGCGQKGPLMLPGDASAPGSPPAATAPSSGAAAGPDPDADDEDREQRRDSR